MDFSFADNDLALIVQEVAGLIDSSRDLPKEAKRERRREQKEYVDSLVAEYIDRYRTFHDNRLPSRSLLGEAISAYVIASKEGKREKNMLREVLLGSLERYASKIRQSYTKPNSFVI